MWNKTSLGFIDVSPYYLACETGIHAELSTLPYTPLLSLHIPPANMWMVSCLKETADIAMPK